MGDVYIPRHYGSGDPKGYAFVRFHELRDAEDAMKEMDGKFIDGREIRVQLANRKRPEDPRGFYASRRYARYYLKMNCTLIVSRARFNFSRNDRDRSRGRDSRGGRDRRSRSRSGDRRRVDRYDRRDRDERRHRSRSRSGERRRGGDRERFIIYTPCH